MLEPKPLVVKSSQVHDGRTRIGVVLPEDALTKLTITIGRFELRLSGGATLNPGAEYSIAAQGSAVSICSGSDQVLESSQPVSIEGANFFPEEALGIYPIIAGRSFHWKKEIDAKFPGEFEITAIDGVLQVVNILPFEQYLACVVVSEMSSGTPSEFVKAQTVSARSWAKCFLNEKHPGETFELCNDDDCQRYHGVTFASPAALQAALETTGEYLIDRNDCIVPGYYSKCCGGISADPKMTFGFEVHGLRSVIDGQGRASADDINKWVGMSGDSCRDFYCGGNKEDLLKSLGGVDEVGEYFRWKHEESKTDLAKYLNEKSKVADAALVSGLDPLQRGPSGRIHKLEIEYQTGEGHTKKHLVESQYEIRALLHPSFLYSSAISITDVGESFIFHGAGWGHGVGLCQIGATFQALAGRSYQEILALYFPETSLRKLY